MWPINKQRMTARNKLPQPEEHEGRGEQRQRKPQVDAQTLKKLEGMMQQPAYPGGAGAQLMAMKELLRSHETSTDILRKAYSTEKDADPVLGKAGSNRKHAPAEGIWSGARLELATATEAASKVQEAKQKLDAKRLKAASGRCSACNETGHLRSSNKKCKLHVERKQTGTGIMSEQESGNGTTSNDQTKMLQQALDRMEKMQRSADQARLAMVKEMADIRRSVQTVQTSSPRQRGGKRRHASETSDSDPEYEEEEGGEGTSDGEMYNPEFD